MSSAVAWPAQAAIEVRAQIVGEFVRYLFDPKLTIQERCAVDAAVTLAADDPAPRVRLALAEAIGTLPAAPIHILATLATDRPDIAGLVLARSPALRDEDLIDLLPRLDPRVLPIVGARAHSSALAALLVEAGDAEASAALLQNPAVELGTTLLEAIADRYGHHPEVRAQLLARPDLPVSARYALVESLCTALSATSIVTSILGERRMASIVEDAQGAALVEAAVGRSTVEIEQLVHEIEARSGIDASMLLRALSFGQRDLFAALLSRLSGVGRNRTRSILKGVRLNALTGLFERCDLSPNVAAMFADCTVAAVRMETNSGPGEITVRLLEVAHATDAETAALLVALRRWHVEAMQRGGASVAAELRRAA